MSAAVPEASVAAVLLPAKADVPEDEVSEIERALDAPRGSPRLESLARPGMKTVVMVSDATRPCPSWKLLPPLLKRLSKAGVSDSDITIVFGMGIHRPQTEAEKRSLVGEEVYRRIRCVESTQSGRYVYLGTTARGTPVEVCPEVADCDLLICTGNIEYHYFAGYSGGAKAVLPGACGRRTVEANHSMQLMPGAELGSYDENPVRQDIEEAGRMIGVDFILNVVLNEAKHIVRAVAGDPLAAHAAGRREVDTLYGVPISGPTDIVLASAGGRPKDINLYQAQKALENAARAVNVGGTIVLVAECPEGLGEPVFEGYMTGYPLEEIIERIRSHFVLGGHKAAAIARILQKTHVHLVSRMDEGLVRACKMTPFSGVQEALEAAFRKHGSAASVTVMPYGGSAVPLLGRPG